MARDGPAGLSLREIARQAGFSPASLYEYFDGREAIVDALSHEVVRSLADALARAVRPADARATLVELGLAYVTWARECPQDFLLLFDRLPARRRGLADRVPDGSPFGIVLSAARALAAGRHGAERLAYGVWAAAHGMAILQLRHLAGFEADFAAVDRSVFEAIVAGAVPA